MTLKEQYENLKDRKVGAESRKTYKDKILSGFFDKYMQGKGSDLGATGYEADIVPILPTAEIVDLTYPGYDGLTLPFPDESQDYIYNSHVLEHIPDPYNAIKDWFRVLKVGGHLVIAVPHKFLYERKETLPSLWNGDHRRLYTPASLLKEIEDSLAPNTYRIRLLEDGDKDYGYNQPVHLHPYGQLEITVVVEKIHKPIWDLLP